MLLDLDGVLYVGDEGVPHAAEALEQARRGGVRRAFVTNNASRLPSVVAEHLTRLGVPADEDDVVTSAQAALRWLEPRVARGLPVLVLGSEDLVTLVERGGYRPVRTLDQAGDEPVAAVVQGLAPTTSLSDLGEACLAIRAGALWVAGNADATYPSARGAVPGNGAMVAALALALGRQPVVVGKPEPELHQASLERIGANRPLVVGDRLDTDVLGAIRGGTDSLLVMTGVTDVDELLAAPLGQRPTYVAPDLRGLNQPQPEVRVEAERAWCGRAEARREGGGVVADTTTVEGLRAACALAWS